MIAQAAYDKVRELVAMPESVRSRVLDDMSVQDVRLCYEALRFDWELWRRPKQQLPGGFWRWVLFSAGRSFGKTRLATEAIRGFAESGEHQYLALVGATEESVKRILLYGPAGLISNSPRWYKPTFKAGDSVIEWPRHPSSRVMPRCYVMSAEDPDRLRGNEISRCVLDELTTWNRPDEGLRNMDLALRHGSDPRGVICVTPKRTGTAAQISFSKDLLMGKRDKTGKRKQRPDMIVIHGSSMENVDIDDKTRKSWEIYRGTADELTELEGRLPEEAENALWRRDILDKFRAAVLPPDTTIERLIVSVDPSRSKIGAGDLCGIIVLALGSNGDVYVLADWTLRASPDDWINQATAAVAMNRADQGIYEGNRLGEDNRLLLEQRAREKRQRWIQVTARGTKKQRAEPIAALFKAGRVHIVGTLTELEDELTGWDPNEKSESPNRIDALVHGVKALVLTEGSSRPRLAAR